MSNYREGQVHQLVNALEASGFTPEEITKLGQYPKLRDFRDVLNERSEIIRKRHPVVEAKIYLRRLEVVNLGAVDGTGNYETAKKVFQAGFDTDFEKLGIVFSGIAPETNIAVDELIKDGEFLDFLGNTSEELERIRMVGAQFEKFCREHPGKLGETGAATFAILTKGDAPVALDRSNTYVALVRILWCSRICA